MEIKIKEIQIDRQAIVPTLTVGFWLEFDYFTESPISITGRLLTNNKVVAQLNEYQLNTGYDFGLKILSRNKKNKLHIEQNSNRYFAQLSASLTNRTIEYIENQREKRPEKSVNFSIEFIVKTIEILAEPEKITNDVFLNVKIKKHSKNWEIKQSDWIRNYSPYLGIGNFLLLELEIPEKEKVSENWIKLYERLYLRLAEMKDALQNGDWQKTLIISRQFIEGLKFDTRQKKQREFKEDFKTLFINDQFSEQGFDEFYNGIKAFFNYTSKYIHDKNKTGELNIVPIPTKEDAYFVYALGIGLLNIIGKKSNKGSR